MWRASRQAATAPGGWQNLRPRDSEGAEGSCERHREGREAGGDGSLEVSHRRASRRREQVGTDPHRRHSPKKTFLRCGPGQEDRAASAFPALGVRSEGGAHRQVLPARGLVAPVTARGRSRDFIGAGAAGGHLGPDSHLGGGGEAKARLPGKGWTLPESRWNWLFTDTN